MVACMAYGTHLRVKYVDVEGTCIGVVVLHACVDDAQCDVPLRRVAVLDFRHNFRQLFDFRNSRFLQQLPCAASTQHATPQHQCRFHQLHEVSFLLTQETKSHNNIQHALFQPVNCPRCCY